MSSNESRTIGWVPGGDIFGTEFKHQQRATFSILSGMPGIVHQVHSGSPINIALKIHRCIGLTLKKTLDIHWILSMTIWFSLSGIRDLIYEGEHSIDLYSDFSLHEWSWHWSFIILSFLKRTKEKERRDWFWLHWSSNRWLMTVTMTLEFYSLLPVLLVFIAPF